MSDLKVGNDKKFNVQQHINTVKHKAAIKIYLNHKNSTTGR